MGRIRGAVNFIITYITSVSLIDCLFVSLFAIQLWAMDVQCCPMSTTPVISLLSISPKPACSSPVQRVFAGSQSRPHTLQPRSFVAVTRHGPAPYHTALLVNVPLFLIVFNLILIILIWFYIWTFDVLVCPLSVTECFLLQPLPLIRGTVFHRTPLLPLSLHLLLSS